MIGSIGRRVPAALFVLLVMPLVLPAQDPEYPHGEFEDDCTLCHNSESWRPVEVSAEFDHAKRGFALEGSHRSADCRACHRTLEFLSTEKQCASCHLDAHRGELGLDCERCHTSRSFIDRSSMIRGHLATRLPLDGRHRVIDCEDCHAPSSPGILQFVNLPDACDACHLEAYLGTSDPDHQDSGFSRQCDRCHKTRAWLPASFNHAELSAGALCVECHLDDYLATSNPPHQPAGFPQQCEDCHSTHAWEPATFDHESLFPIQSGKHKGKWNACSDCHVNPSNYSQFSCIDCHEHDDPADLGDKHDEVAGYVYESGACFSCHPTGDE